MDHPAVRAERIMFGSILTDVGVCQWRSVHPYLRGHAPAARTAKSSMRATKAKPQGKRLNRSVESCADHINIRVSSDANATCRSQIGRQVPEPTAQFGQIT